MSKSAVLETNPCTWRYVVNLKVSLVTNSAQNRTRVASQARSGAKLTPTVVGVALALVTQIQPERESCAGCRNLFLIALLLLVLGWRRTEFVVMPTQMRLLSRTTEPVTRFVLTADSSSETGGQFNHLTRKLTNITGTQIMLLYIITHTAFCTITFLNILIAKILDSSSHIKKFIISVI